MDAKRFIAKRAAMELRDGDVVNLGIGLPTLVSDFIPEGVHITLQSENGILGSGPIADGTNTNLDISNAGGVPVTVQSGASFFDSATSFAVIRGGHVDLSILGALQVDETGTLASHIIPGKRVPGMGGAMDLVVGSKKVIVVTTHTNDGAPKILKKITLPATAVGKVNMIITELAVMEITPEGVLLKELAPGVTAEEVQARTEARLIIAKDLMARDAWCG